MGAKPFLARLGLSIPAATLLTLGAASNVVLDTATGSQIGTATNQKLGFYGATPIVQPVGTTDLRTALINLGLYASGGASPLNLNGGALTAQTVTASSLTSGRITTAGASGLLQDFAGLAIVGTPSATAPSTGTNGPGLVNGIAHQAADGSTTSCLIPVGFGNGSGVTAGIMGFVCQGTAAIPGATSTGDNVGIIYRGYDSANFTGTKGAIQIFADSTWTPTSTPTYVRFGTCATSSTSFTTAGRIDPNQTLVWGGNFNSVGTFSGGTLRPHIQTASTNTANAGIVQTMWNAGSSGPIGIFAKSRSGTPGTPGVITAADTLGTLSWQGDDNTNFIEAAQIKVVQQGTVASTRMGGKMTISTGTDAAPTVMTAALTIDNVQQVAHLSTVDSTSIITGCAVFSGGIGVAKRITLDGGTGKTLRIVNINANAAVAVTLGSTGCTGTTAGAPQGWMRIDINGTDRFIPFW